MSRVRLGMLPGMLPGAIQGAAGAGTRRDVGAVDARRSSLGDVQLTKDIITDAAIGILDEYGLQDLTIRRLARHLDSAAGAMYWHFPSKQALLGAVAGRILAGAGDPCGTGDWQSDVAAYASALHGALVAHNDGAEVVSAALATGTLDASPALVFERLLRPSGLDAGERADAADTLLYFILGATVDEQTAGQLAALGSATDGAGSPARSSDPGLRIRRGVALITTGIATRSRSVHPA